MEPKLYRVHIFDSPGEAIYDREVKPLTASEVRQIWATSRAKAEILAGSMIILKCFEGVPRKWIGRVEEIAS